MKSHGKFLQRLAIIALVIMSIVIVINYFMSASQLAETREDLEDQNEEHQSSEDCRGLSCTTCESYKEREEDLDRSSLQLFMNVVQSILLYCIFAGVLYGVGEIATRLSAGTPAIQASSAPTGFCPHCGSEIAPGTRFCRSCGANIEN